MKHLQFFSILFFLPLTVLAQAPAGGDPAAGKGSFDLFCATCHGPTGVGDGPGATALNPKPRNLQQTTRTDDELKKIIKEGGASVGRSPLMVAGGGVLSDAAIANVVA